jgi:hypothetical protein
VFGEHIACPVGGQLLRQNIALDGLDDLEEVQFVLEDLPAEAIDKLRESGATEHTAAGPLALVVSIVQTLLKGVFLASGEARRSRCRQRECVSAAGRQHGSAQVRSTSICRRSLGPLAGFACCGSACSATC